MITFENITKQFGDGTVALDRVSFHVEPGELVVITGPSGSGKTTLMRLLIRDFEPTEGEITYKGEALSSLAQGKVPFHRRRIGVVFQDYRLLPELNVWENIALPLSIMGKGEGEIESRVTDLLSLVRLTDRALVFPKQLSGGEAQRVSIARALATGPNVIFADEPTGNLDKESSLSIMKLLQQINSLGTTVLLATHDVTLLDFLKNERRIELEKGKLNTDSDPKKSPAKINQTEEDEVKKSKDKKQEKTDKSDKKDDQELAAEFSEPELKFADAESEPKKNPGFKLPSIKLPSLKLPTFGKKEKSVKSAAVEPEAQSPEEEDKEE
jgi:cell division transport system ATP-binding protein